MDRWRLPISSGRPVERACWVMNRNLARANHSDQPGGSWVSQHTKQPCRRLGLGPPTEDAEDAMSNSTAKLKAPSKMPGTFEDALVMDVGNGRASSAVSFRSPPRPMAAGRGQGRKTMGPPC